MTPTPVIPALPSVIPAKAGIPLLPANAAQ